MSQKPLLPRQTPPLYRIGRLFEALEGLCVELKVRDDAAREIDEHAARLRELLEAAARGETT